MLEVLSDGERQMLFELLSKVVMGASEWEGKIPTEATIKTEGNAQ